MWQCPCGIFSKKVALRLLRLLPGDYVGPVADLRRTVYED